MRQKCVKNGSCFIAWEKRNVQNTSEIRQNCVKNASKMRGTPLGENTFWTIPTEMQIQILIQWELIPYIFLMRRYWSYFQVLLWHLLKNYYQHWLLPVLRPDLSAPKSRDSLRLRRRFLPLPEKSRDFLRPQDARFPLRRKPLANRDFFCDENRLKVILVAEFPAIPSSVVKIASERRCAILVHSGPDTSHQYWLKIRLPRTW